MIEDALRKPYRVFLFDTEEHYDELVAITTRAIQADPHNGIALNNREVAKWEIGLLHDMERFDEAIVHYDTAIHLQPEFKRTYDDLERANARLPLVES